MSNSLLISIKAQQLDYLHNHKTIASFPVSTSKHGTGNQNNSFKTPLGLHKIKLKIGKNCPVNTVFKSRRPTGYIYRPEYKQVKKDWILTRILWLQGLEPNINSGKGIDSLRRFIYIHGTPDSEPMGTAKSHGCIRMCNIDIIKLFDLVSVDTLVEIKL